MKRNSVLHFFTSSFPYGRGENFIINEITHLGNSFDKVYIYPRDDVHSLPLTKDIPENAEIRYLMPFNGDKGIYFKLLISNLASVLYILWYEIFKDKKAIRRKNKIKDIRLLLRKIIEAIFKAKQLEKVIQPDDQFYSYWMNTHVTMLSYLQMKKKIHNFIFRVHGFDVYDDRNARSYLPFRLFNYAHANQIVCISKAGLLYLKSNFPQFSNKFALSYLGTVNHGEQPDKMSSKTVHIVSCSNLIPLKRVDLIASALSYIQDISIIWVHVGEGREHDKVQHSIQSLPSNIQARLLGQMRNEELMNYYQNQYVDFFIHLSETEGIPVSMMEAISFGIPIIATAVGGVPEIVNHSTGILLSADSSANEIAGVLSAAIEKNSFSKQLDREGIKTYWANNFNGDKNYESFINNFLSN